MAGIADLVTVPRRAGRARLAYITPAEAEHLRRANVGGANPEHRTYRGPAGLPRLDDGSGGSDGGDGGGGGQDGGGSASGGGGGTGGDNGSQGDGGAQGTGSGSAGTEGAGAGMSAAGDSLGGMSNGPDVGTEGMAGTETGQTGGAGYGSSTGVGAMDQSTGLGMDGFASAGMGFGPAGTMSVSPGAEAGYGPGAVTATGLDPGLGGVPGLNGPPAPGLDFSDKANVGAPPGFGLSISGALTTGLGLLGGPVAALAGIGVTNALGINPNPAGQALGVGFGLAGAALGGPIGGALGSALGAAVGGALGAHGTNGDAPGGSGTGHGGAGTAGGDNLGLGLGSAYRSSANQPFTDGSAGGGLLSRATGGRVEGPTAGGGSMFARGSGLVPGSGLGRADSTATSVPHGSYVVPADVVSGIGQGNSAAGAKRLGSGLRGLPRFARGGDVSMVPVRLSGGEYVVHPSHVAAIGAGSVAAGSAKLDRMVHRVRATAVHTTLHALPPR